MKEECDKLLSQQRHLQSKLHALEEELGRIHSKVTFLQFLQCMGAKIFLRRTPSTAVLQSSSLWCCLSCRL